MFICDGCLHAHFHNKESLSTHHGKCGVCKEKTICNDIPYVRLVKKSKDIGSQMVVNSIEGGGKHVHL